jgi:hypothetical protein
LKSTLSPSVGSQEKALSGADRFNGPIVKRHPSSEASNALPWNGESRGPVLSHPLLLKWIRCLRMGLPKRGCLSFALGLQI